MAIIRSSSRSAPRHSGDLWHSGYEYVSPNRFKLRLGPWKGFDLASMASGSAMEDTARLLWVRDARIDEYGHINQYGFYDAGSALGTTLWVGHVRANEHVRLSLATGDVLEVQVTDGLTSSTYTSSFTATGATRGCAQRWGNFLYFSSDASGALYKVHLDTGVFSTVPSSPVGAVELFLLDNNLCAVTETADGHIEVHWAVDSLPENWTGIGSGSSVRYDISAPYGGVGLIEQSAILIGRKHATRMAPTRVASPAFAFRPEDSIHGSLLSSPQGVATTHDGSIYYLDTSGYLARYAGGRVTKVMSQEVINPLALYYSPLLDYLCISTDLGTTFFEGRGLYMINPDTGEIVSYTRTPDNLNGNFDAFADVGCCRNDYGGLRLYAGGAVFDIDARGVPATGQVVTFGPALETPRVLFPADLHIEYIELQSTLDITLSANFDALVRLTYENGVVDSRSFDSSSIDVKGSIARIHLNVAARGVQVRWGAEVTGISGPLLAQGTYRPQHMDIVMNLQERAEGDLL